ncbi:MAG TPA: hypothetical protein VFJ97_17845 [Dermatophilaceae bacterium]|nr:hypothetical protein [Dermatophilaceae bacterium]
MSTPTADDAEHTPPEDLDDSTIEALGMLSEVLEKTERARGRLYDFHQLTGAADMKLDEAVELFRKAGHQDVADRVEQQLVGRNVLPGMWTFQILEAYDDGYFRAFREVEQQVRKQLAGGRRHLYEAQLKRQRRQGKSYD